MRALKALALVATVLALAGCSQPDENGQVRHGQTCEGLCSRWSYIQELPDGRSVICAAASDALSCDWANAR